MLCSCLHFFPPTEVDGALIVGGSVKALDTDQASFMLQRGEKKFQNCVKDGHDRTERVIELRRKKNITGETCT